MTDLTPKFAPGLHNKNQDSTATPQPAKSGILSAADAATASVVSDPADIRVIAELSTTKRTREDTELMVIADEKKRQAVITQVEKFVLQIENYFSKNRLRDPLEAREQASVLGIRTATFYDLAGTRDALLEIQTHRDRLVPLIVDYGSACAYLKQILDEIVEYIAGSGLMGSEWEIKSWARKLVYPWPAKLAEYNATHVFLLRVWENLDYQTTTISRVQATHEAEIRLGTTAMPTESAPRQPHLVDTPNPKTISDSKPILNPSRRRPLADDEIPGTAEPELRADGEGDISEL